MSDYAAHDVVGFSHTVPENVRHPLLDGSEHVQTMARHTIILGSGLWINKNDIDKFMGDFVNLSTGEFKGYPGFYLDGEISVDRAYSVEDFVNISFVGKRRSA